MKFFIYKRPPDFFKTICTGWIFYLCFLTTLHKVYAQPVPHSGLSGIMSTLNNSTDIRPVEKLHFQLDKPWYSPGDTIWFKSYLFDGTFLNASSLSGVLYVELVSDSNIVEKRIMLPVTMGLSWGNIALDERSKLSGNYTLRAYTNWMRNFGKEYLFEKRLFIGDASIQQWLISLHTEILKDENSNKAHINLKVNNIDNTAVKSRSMQVKVVNGNSSLYQVAVTSNADKGFDFNFMVPEKNHANRMGIILQDAQRGTSTTRIYVPLFLNRPEDIDLQFMPESGYLVTGINSKIGFKAIAENGRGVTISGTIVNGRGEKLTMFTSDFRGMGFFNLKPAAGETYSAIVAFPGGTTINYALPPVKISGTSLSIINSLQRDSIDIIVSCTPDIITQNQGYYIIGQSRGIVCLGGFAPLTKQETKLTIDKKNFPTGIAHFTLLNADKVPVNERIAFVNHNDLLNIGINSNKSFYSKRDSIALEIRVTNKDSLPVEASFSLAVTDDNQVVPDNIFDNTIVSDMLLTSDLKGLVEDPGYYFENINNTESWNRLDNLMLTQGWVGYHWTDLLSAPTPVKYNPEPYFSVKGKVTNIFNKPVSNSGIVLLARNPTLIRDTITNTDGEFSFTNLFPQDTASFLLQARNKKGKSFNVGIEVEEFKPPVFEMNVEREVPWFVNIDSTSIKSLHTRLLYNTENDKVSGRNKMLQEVFVIGKKIIRDSKNLNGDGEADLTLTSADLVKAGKTTLGLMMERNVKGFSLGGKDGRTYVVFGTRLHLVIDGVFVESLLPGGLSLYEYYKNFFDYYTAEDIKGIEVMRTGKYQMSYTTRFLDPLAIPWEHVFIEITTYGGKGPFLKKVPGIYLYKPMPFSFPRQFYAPRYNTDSLPNFIDTRSTIHWEPNIITDKEGKATVSFYAADHGGNYTVIIQGSDMNGNVGASRQKLLIKIP